MPSHQHQQPWILPLLLLHQCKTSAFFQSSAAAGEEERKYKSERQNLGEKKDSGLRTLFAFSRLSRVLREEKEGAIGLIWYSRVLR
jgi:hypothetical protein